jgi:hypothetical protein
MADPAQEVLTLEVGAVPCADRAALFDASGHQLPVFAAQEAPVPGRSHEETQCLELVGGLERQMLVEQDGERHGTLYFRTGAGGSRSNSS